ncbi:MAG: hypothetical protein J5J00_11630 [Deltaproteobacteria bacterium]|nr:hypothetical protein [Deltaproteobacteria bacterium]
MFQIVISSATFLLVLFAVVRGYLSSRRFRTRIEELERQLLEAESFLSRHGKLANEIAHEIKNPITAILCSAEALELLLGDSLAEDHRKTLRYIKEYGDNLLRLVSNFIDVSRAETGNISANPKPFEIKPVIDSVVGLLSASSERKEIAVKVYCPDERLRAVADPIHIKQIVFNLLHNAIKFTSKQGEIRINIESDFPNPYIKIAVKDNGQGIPGARLQSLFDPYGKCDMHVSGVYAAVAPGVGLGLALCKRLVELAGGKIAVESQMNIGTCFEFSLPLAIESDAELAPRRHAEEPVTVLGEQPLQGQRFLLVNSVPQSFGPVRDLIEAWGGHVDIVAQAVDALNAVHDNDYDAVMLDEQLQVPEWPELIRSLRAEGRGKSTTIIIAGDRYFESSMGEESDFDRILSKPFNGKVLLDALITSGKFQVTH